MSLTTKDAKAIAKKLNGVPSKSRAHDIYKIFYEGRFVSKVGVRRASRDIDHGHLPNDLHLTQQETKRLSECTLSKDEYFRVLFERGMLL